MTNGKKRDWALDFMDIHIDGFMLPLRKKKATAKAMNTDNHKRICARSIYNLVFLSVIGHKFITSASYFQGSLKWILSSAGCPPR